MDRALLKAFWRCMAVMRLKRGLTIWMFRFLARTMGTARTRSLALQSCLDALPDNPHPDRVADAIETVARFIVPSLGEKQMNLLACELVSSAYGLFSREVAQDHARLGAYSR